MSEKQVFQIEILQTATVIVEVKAKTKAEAERKALKKVKAKDFVNGTYEDCLRIVDGQSISSVNKHGQYEYKFLLRDAE